MSGLEPSGEATQMVRGAMKTMRDAEGEKR